MAVAEVPHTEEKHLNNGFLAAHVKDTQIRFIPATTEWPGVKYWEPECIRTPDTGSEDNSWCGTAVTEVPQAEKHWDNVEARHAQEHEHRSRRLEAMPAGTAAPAQAFVRCVAVLAAVALRGAQPHA
ncbi:uncharacterized protein LOC119173373 [Rhipicephalus microplus]|uniref:uncharacterized protein LOC119173373 n=1 Tax=Rhipicephalus microplus TaxID=6941 RepID=UPI003F6D5E75